MENSFKQYKSLVKALILQKKIKTHKGDANKNKKISQMVGLIIAVAFVAVYFCIYAINLTMSGNAIGLHKEALGTILGLSQIIIMFFGLIAIMSFMYFSKDNELLSSLPLHPNVIFSAKFTMAYLSELLLCLAFALPTALTYGIFSIVGLNIAIPASFFVILILSAVTLPIIPLLFVSIISIPLMYVVTFVKKRKMLSNIIVALLFVVIMIVYFLAIGSIYGGTDAEGNYIVSDTIKNMIVSMNNIMFFNRPLVDALYGIGIFKNLVFYILILLGSGALSLFVSQLFYKRVLTTSNEGSKNISSNKNKKSEDLVANNFIKSYTKKEIKSIMGNSTMFINTIMMLIMPFIMMVFFSFTMGQDNKNDGTLMTVGLTTYIYTIMLSSSPIMAIGISREGKNLAVLKALPIDVKDLIKVKLNLGFYSNLFVCVLTIVLMPIITKTKFYTGLIVGIISFLSSYGVNCISLKTDLKKPNLKWQNFTELTKNNKTMIKPMLTSLGIGFLNMALGALLAFAPMKISMDLRALIYTVICLIPAVLVAVVGRRKLYSDAEMYYERIEI